MVSQHPAQHRNLAAPHQLASAVSADTAASITARIGTPRRAFMFLSPPKDISPNGGAWFDELTPVSAFIGLRTQRALTGLPRLPNARAPSGVLDRCKQGIVGPYSVTIRQHGMIDLNR
jgi:hypothetical protein